MELSVEVHGPPRGDPSSKGTIVLLHGWPDSAKLWAPLQGYLSARGWRTVAPNLPGHGPGEPAFHGSSSDVAAACTAVVDREAPCVLLGHDWGAHYALLVTKAAAPGSVTRLVCLDVGAEVDTSWTNLLFLLSYQGFLALVHRLAPRAIGDPATRWVAGLFGAPAAAEATSPGLYHYYNFLLDLWKGRGRRAGDRGGGAGRGAGARPPFMFCYGTPFFSSARWRAKVAAVEGNCVLGFRGGHWFFLEGESKDSFHDLLGAWIEGLPLPSLPSGAAWSPGETGAVRSRM